MTAHEPILSAIEPFQACDLINCFNQLFSDSLNTQLIGAGEEPIYLPADEGVDYHRIIFTRDYFASALHEIAHWCVAGEKRRLEVDYGYWYAPDGRTEDQQRLFEQVEVKPQAMEWIFSVACGYRFRVSADNLAAGLGASDEFKAAIYQQVLQYCEQGLPQRPALFTQTLAHHYGVVNPLDTKHYSLEQL